MWLLFSYGIKKVKILVQLQENMKMIIVIVLVLVLITCYWYFTLFYTDQRIRSTIDQNEYVIRHGNTKSRTFLLESANMLALINIRIEKLIQHLLEKYSNDNTRNYFIKQLRERYSFRVLSEATVDQRYTTFTVNKSDINICLRTRDSNEHVYDINTLMYVLLHELAHMCNFNIYGQAIIGHGKEFIDIFSLLVKESISIGVYTFVDYRVTPVEYCNIMINTSVV